jgi:hypothetical protein
MRYKLETEPFPDGKIYRNTLSYIPSHAVRFKLSTFIDLLGHTHSGGYSAIHWQSPKTIDNFIAKKMAERYHKKFGGKQRYYAYDIVAIKVVSQS